MRVEIPADLGGRGFMRRREGRSERAMPRPTRSTFRPPSPLGGVIRCAVKLRRSGRRYQALTPQGSIGGVLLLDGLLND